MTLVTFTASYNYIKGVQINMAFVPFTSLTIYLDLV